MKKAISSKALPLVAVALVGLTLASSCEKVKNRRKNSNLYNC